jgi:hypothetical protein
MGQARTLHRPLCPSPAVDQMNATLVQAPLVADLDWPDIIEARTRALERHCGLRDQESSVMCCQLIVGITQLHDEAVLLFRVVRQFLSSRHIES